MTGRYKAYPEYKESGVEWVGEIPTDWSMWKLAHAFNEIGSGTTPPTNNEEWFKGDVPWITTGELREKIITDTKKKLSDRTLTTFPTLKKYPVGSVAIAMYGATIGRLGLFGVEATTNQACCVMTASKQLDNKYLFYWLWAFKEDIIRLSSGGGQPNINQEKVASLKVSAPKPEEQRNIANFLDHETAKIDTLITKQEKLIELLKEKRQAVISHAVTKGLNPDTPMKDSGVEWLGAVPEHWNVIKLSSCAKVTRLAGYEYTAYWKPTENGEITAIRGQNIRFNKLVDLDKTEKISASLSQKLSRSKLNRGDIAYPCVGSIGYAVLIEEDNKYHINQNIAKLTPNDSTDPLFFTYFLNSEVCLESALFLNTSDAQPSILVGNLRRVKVAIPSIDEQKAIGNFLQRKLADLDLINTKALHTINLMKERKTALISAAVTGKIDVRHFVSEQGQLQGVQG